MKKQKEKGKKKITLKQYLAGLADAYIALDFPYSVDRIKMCMEVYMPKYFNCEIEDAGDKMIIKFDNGQIFRVDITEEMH